MTIGIGRRQFIFALGGATVVWPLAARAQQPAMAVIAVLHIGMPFVYPLSGLREGLKDVGYVEGQNLTIEYRWANNDVGRLPKLAADLVQHRVGAIVTLTSGAATLAAKNATSTIPIVFGYGGDPVEAGLVESINRPGGNVTGVTSLSGELGGKQLGFLHELLPNARRFAVLLNPKNPATESLATDAQTAASATGRDLEVLKATTSGEIDAAFDRIVADKVHGLLITTDTLFADRRVQLITLAARYAVPTIFPFRENVEAGGLMSYGPNLAERDRQVGVYVGRILSGEKPADLPVMRATKFEFLINKQTAKILGLTVPNTLLALADEVIE
ncbi:MAG: ABC transporter substrate-binding protein [Xanthobacteraceae bacterium]|jgi:putative ABC transport system substrate-binding protein